MNLAIDDKQILAYSTISRRSTLYFWQSDFSTRKTDGNLKFAKMHEECDALINHVSLDTCPNVSTPRAHPQAKAPKKRSFAIGQIQAASVAEVFELFCSNEPSVK